MKKHDLTDSINRFEERRTSQLKSLGVAIDLMKFLLTKMNSVGDGDGGVAWVTLEGTDIVEHCEKCGIKFASEERKELFLQTLHYNLMAAPLTNCDVWNLGHLLFHAEEHEDTVH